MSRVPPTSRRLSSVSLPDVPTAEEIAAALRHRPAGAVIADICRDLGIVPAHPLWREVMLVVAEHGGCLVKLLKDSMHRVRTGLAASSAVDADGWPAAPSPPATAGGTGPP